MMARYKVLDCYIKALGTLPIDIFNVHWQPFICLAFQDFACLQQPS